MSKHDVRQYIPFPYITGLTPQQQYEIERDFLALSSFDDWWVVWGEIDMDYTRATSGHVDLSFLGNDQNGDAFEGYPQVPLVRFTLINAAENDDATNFPHGETFHLLEARVWSWTIVDGLYVGADVLCACGHGVVGAIQWSAEGFA